MLLYCIVCAIIVGYFTSRPALKAYVREMNGLLQTCSHAEAMLGVVGGKPSTHSRKILRKRILCKLKTFNPQLMYSSAEGSHLQLHCFSYYYYYCCCYCYYYYY